MSKNQKKEDKIILNSFSDALLDDSDERLNKIIETYTGYNGPKYGNNILLVHLIKNIKKLNKSTSFLNKVMISLIVVQIGLILMQFSVVKSLVKSILGF